MNFRFPTIDAARKGIGQLSVTAADGVKVTAGSGAFTELWSFIPSGTGTVIVCVDVQENSRGSKASNISFFSSVNTSFFILAPIVKAVSIFYKQRGNFLTAGY